MRLKDIKLIDLKHSELDMEKSDLQKGTHVFKKDSKGRDKICVLDYTDTTHLPDHKLIWGPAGGQDRMEWHYMGAKAVTAEDPYLALGVPLNADGHYQVPFSDTVLMMIPMQLWIDKRYADVKKQERLTGYKQREFEDSLPKDAQLTGYEKDALQRKIDSLGRV